MALKIKSIPLFVVLIANATFAQITAIPDEGFEQALIDMNIDSDGVINGEVLTADINNIIELDFSNLYDSFPYDGVTITDFTGIEDFTSLEILNLFNLDIFLANDQSGIFNSNLNLKEFKADDSCVDCGPSTIIPYLDFSSLNNLEYISLINSDQINSINLNNPNSSYEDLTIDLSHEYWDPPSTYTVCINVNDVQAAQSNQYPYNTWTVITPEPDQNGYVWRDFEFSSTCTLSTINFDIEVSLSIYPNPVQNKLWFDNPNQIEINKVEIFNVSGQIISSFTSVRDYLNVESLIAGVYFVRISNEQSSITLKVLKK